MKAAVVGAGYMGANHARAYTELDTTELVGVADPNEETGRRLAARYRINSYSDYRRMLDEERPDVLTVAVPTVLHAQVACDAMERGIHVLIEKPLALTPEEGRKIVATAERCGVNAMVGHIERFNPAVIEIKKRLLREEIGRVLQVHARRLSPLPDRINDVGVVLDLASHDIDVIRYLLGSPVRRVHAELQQRTDSSYEDLLSALLRFENGVIGVLDVNWVSPTKVRQLGVLGESGMYLADYLTQDLYWFQNNAAAADSYGAIRFLRGVAEGDMVKIRIDKREPLMAEVTEFISSVLEQREPVVTCRDGLATLELTTHLIEVGTKDALVTVDRGGQQ
jgi:UDP-N-acetylglucosamine 3-dehydrogenase